MPRKKKSVLNQGVVENPEVKEEVIVTKPEPKKEVTEEETKILEPKPEIEKALESIDIVPVENAEKPEDVMETETEKPEIVVKEVKTQSVADRRRALRSGMKP